MTLGYKFCHCACTLFASWRSSGAEIALRFRKCQATVPNEIPNLVNALCIHKLHHWDWFFYKMWPQQCSLWNCCHFRHFLLVSCLVDVLEKLENRVQREEGGTAHCRARQTCGTKKESDGSNLTSYLGLKAGRCLPSCIRDYLHTNRLDSCEIKDWKVFGESENVEYEVLGVQSCLMVLVLQ